MTKNKLFSFTINDHLACRLKKSIGDDKEYNSMASLIREAIKDKLNQIEGNGNGN